MNSTRVRIAGAAVATAVALGAILFAERPSAAPSPPPSAVNRPPAGQVRGFQGLSAPNMSTSDSVPGSHSADPPSAPSPSDSDAPSRGPSPPEPVDPAEYLAHAPQDPITPPVIHVEAQLAPGSVPTSEPLTPPVIEVPSPVPIDPASVTAEPLTPPVVVANPEDER